MIATTHTRRRRPFGLIACVFVVLALSACRSTSRRAVVPDSSAVQGAPVPMAAPAATPTVAPTASLARIPRDAARFEIEVVDDSTARFKPREALWVKPGMHVYVVDPLNRDALVARLRLTSVWNETAVGVVTSQVTRVTTQHVVLIIRPVTPWWKSRRFWVGTLLGGVFGGAVGVVAAQ